MRCGCSVCSAYMVQLENGLKSGCVCPECGNFCSYCMGTVQQPKTADELAKIYAGQIDGQHIPLSHLSIRQRSWAAIGGNGFEQSLSFANKKARFGSIKRRI